MLKPRQIIPPLTLRTPQDRSVSAWDFKQKQNLVIAFLDSDCRLCEAFAENLVRHAADLHEKDAVALLIFEERPPASLSDFLPPEIIAGTDVDAHGLQRFLGAQSRTGQALTQRALFVTDRYGEISAQWILPGHDFPGIEAILSSLNSVQIACEECGVPHWPVEE
jgi:hypothetical protein